MSNNINLNNNALHTDVLFETDSYNNLFTKLAINFNNTSFLKGIYFDKTEQELYPIFSVTRQEIVCLLTYFKLSSNFNIDNPIDCFALDKVQELFRFTVSYILQSSFQNFGLKIITHTNEVKPLLSIQGLFSAMNWAEREMWDMSGVVVLKHPDLRRILTDYGFVGHPLRKDFPLTGFYEIFFDNTVLKIAYKSSELPQLTRTTTKSAFFNQSLNTY